MKLSALLSWSLVTVYFKSLLCLIGVSKYFSMTFIFMSEEYPIDKNFCSFATVTEGFNGGCGGDTRLVRI